MCVSMFLSSRNDESQNTVPAGHDGHASASDQRACGGPWSGQLPVGIIVLDRTPHVPTQFRENHLTPSSADHPSPRKHHWARVRSHGLTNSYRTVGSWQRSNGRCKSSKSQTINQSQSVNWLFSSSFSFLSPSGTMPPWTSLAKAVLRQWLA